MFSALNSPRFFSHLAQLKGLQCASILEEMWVPCIFHYPTQSSFNSDLYSAMGPQWAANTVKTTGIQGTTVFTASENPDQYQPSSLTILWEKDIQSNYTEFDKQCISSSCVFQIRCAKAYHYSWVLFNRTPPKWKICQFNHIINLDPYFSHLLQKVWCSDNLH